MALLRIAEFKTKNSSPPPKKKKLCSNWRHYHVRREEIPDITRDDFFPIAQVSSVTYPLVLLQQYCCHFVKNLFYKKHIFGESVVCRIQPKISEPSTCLWHLTWPTKLTQNIQTYLWAYLHHLHTPSSSDQYYKSHSFCNIFTRTPFYNLQEYTLHGLQMVQQLGVWTQS